MFEHIVVPFDLSEEAHMAAHHAGGLAATVPGGAGRVTLLHIDESHWVDDPQREALRPHMGPVSELRTRWLGRVSGQLEERGIRARADIVAGGDGNVAENILRWIEAEGDVDLIVMGRRGLGRLERLFIGSSSKRLCMHAHVPVLVFPRNR